MHCNEFVTLRYFSTWAAATNNHTFQTMKKKFGNRSGNGIATLLNVLFEKDINRVIKYIYKHYLWWWWCWLPLLGLLIPLFCIICIAYISSDKGVVPTKDFLRWKCKGYNTLKKFLKLFLSLKCKKCKCCMFTVLKQDPHFLLHFRCHY